MAKSLSKKSQQRNLTYTLISLLFLIVAATISLVVIFYLPTAGWLTYKSDKVSLSFKYPKDWPISQCSEPILFPQMKIEEVVSFENECDWRQSRNSIGDITIERFNENTDPKRLISLPLADGYNRSLEPIKIGNKTGYLLAVKPNDNNPPTRPISNEENYYVVANNLVYKIRLLKNTFYKDSETETAKTFKKMLSTFQF